MCHNGGLIGGQVWGVHVQGGINKLCVFAILGSTYVHGGSEDISVLDKLVEYMSTCQRRS